MFFQVTHEDLKVSISCHLPHCNLAGSIWWLQEGKDLGNKGSLPNRKGRWRTLRPWHCMWIFKLFIQTIDTFFSSFMKCLLLKFFFSIILSENCFLFFPAHNSVLQIHKTSHFMHIPFEDLYLCIDSLSSEFNSFPEVLYRTSLAVQWLRLCTSNARGTGSTPGQGNKIPHAAWCGKEKFKQFCTENEP